MSESEKPPTSDRNEEHATPNENEEDGLAGGRRDVLKGMLMVGASSPLLLEVSERGSVRFNEGVTPVGERPRFTTMIELTVNGERRHATIEHRTNLLDLLRKQLGVTGPKRGCNRSECGFCTVNLDGETVYSCTKLAKEAAGSEVLTTEGLGSPDDLHPIQEAWTEAKGGQCGFCSPGQIMATYGLLQENPDPTRDEVKHELSGVLCRCGNYEKIADAAELSAEKWRQ